jgi:hypothetical protein
VSTQIQDLLFDVEHEIVRKEQRAALEFPWGAAVAH